jgi:hypothetical protein
MMLLKSLVVNNVNLSSADEHIRYQSSFCDMDRCVMYYICSMILLYCLRSYRLYICMCISIIFNIINLLLNVH